MFESGGSGSAPEADAPGALSDVPESEWASVLRDNHRVIARAQFVEVDSIATVFIARCAADARRGRNEAFHGEFASAEVGTMLRLTERTAERMIGLGVDLRWRLHATSSAFAAGIIDQTRAFAISDALATVSEDKVELIERLLLDGAEYLNTTKLRGKARRLITRHDPGGAKARRESAEADRDVRFHANEDGTCSLEGTLPGPAGRVVAMRQRAMCFDVCGHDPRTFAQRRGDALVTLAAGPTRLRCLCDQPDCTQKEGTTGRSSAAPQSDAPATTDSSDPDLHERTAAGLPTLPAATIHVGVNLTTLLGLDELPGFLAGHGWIGPRALRAGRYPQPTSPATSRRTARGGRSSPSPTLIGRAFSTPSAVTPVSARTNRTPGRKRKHTNPVRAAASSTRTPSEGRQAPPIRSARREAPPARGGTTRCGCRAGGWTPSPTGGSASRPPTRPGTTGPGTSGPRTPGTHTSEAWARHPRAAGGDADSESPPF